MRHTQRNNDAFPTYIAHQLLRNPPREYPCFYSVFLREIIERRGRSNWCSVTTGQSCTAQQARTYEPVSGVGKRTATTKVTEISTPSKPVRKLLQTDETSGLCRIGNGTLRCAQWRPPTGMHDA